jgi:hypothetical protein
MPRVINEWSDTYSSLKLRVDKPAKNSLLLFSLLLLLLLLLLLMIMMMMVLNDTDAATAIINMEVLMLL